MGICGNVGSGKSSFIAALLGQVSYVSSAMTGGVVPPPALSGVLASAVLDAVLRVNSESQAVDALGSSRPEGPTFHTLSALPELSSEAFLPGAPSWSKGETGH